MQPLATQANLTDRVYRAILDEILDGRLAAGEHLIQEQLAIGLGVSRQPVQQAMILLKADGLVEESGRRGMRVAPINIARVADHYELRGVLDGHAARLAAERVSEGNADTAALVERTKTRLLGQESAIKDGSIAELIRHDEAFHHAIYAFSGNTALAEIAAPTWRSVRRAMAHVLHHFKPPEEVLPEHRAILQAILDGDPAQAAALSQDHARSACERLMLPLNEGDRK